MRSLNISCLKTEQTFKNKQTAKRVLLDNKRRHQCTSSSSAARGRATIGLKMIFTGGNNDCNDAGAKETRKTNINADLLLFDDGDAKECSCVKNIDKETGSRSMLMLIAYVIGAVITFLLPTVSAYEVEESITINKPVTRSSSEPQHQQQPWVHFSSEYVRCFCNLPACVSTGYMCKSSGGGCFSDLLDHPTDSIQRSPSPTSVYRGRHGCLELLTDKDQRSWCQNNPNSNARLTLKRKSHPKSLLLCCYHDMCNHADSPETKTFMNSTSWGDILNDNEHRLIENLVQQQESAGYTTADVWFKAATIAVPICGAVILFVLIALAVRILRTETLSSSDHKLGSAYYMHPMQAQNKSCDKMQENYDNGLLKELLVTQHQNCLYSNHGEELQRQIHVPLLLQHNGYESKNETNAKLNLLHQGSSNYCLVSNEGKCNNISSDEIAAASRDPEPSFCKNVNITRIDFADANVCNDKTYVKANVLM